MLDLQAVLAMNEVDLKAFKDDLKHRIKQDKHNAFIKIEDDSLYELGLGAPIAIKNNIQVKGWAIDSSSKILEGYTCPYNATVIDKLLTNRLSPFGICNMDEFAMGSSTENSFHGKTINPYDENKVPGGSSGGSAVAVAANLVPAALGSDTGGSIRQPAAFCGIVGLKPTYGRVSRYGLNAFASSFDQIGPLTNNVSDAAYILDIISGFDEQDHSSAKLEASKTFKHLDPQRKFKIAVIQNFLDQSQDSIKNKTLEIVHLLEQQGHTISYKKLSNTDQHIATYYILSSSEAASNLARYDGVRYGFKANANNLKELFMNTRSEGFGDEVKRRIFIGNFVLSSGYYDAYYAKAQKVRKLIKQEITQLFEEVDLIIHPTTPTTAFKFNEKNSPLEMYLSDAFTVLANLSEIPSISLPIGFDKLNMPIGLSIAATHFEEQKMLDLALSIELALKH